MCGGGRKERRKRKFDCFKYVEIRERGVLCVYAFFSFFFVLEKDVLCWKRGGEKSESEDESEIG